MNSPLKNPVSNMTVCLLLRLIVPLYDAGPYRLALNSIGTEKRRAGNSYKVYCLSAFVLKLCETILKPFSTRFNFQARLAASCMQVFAPRPFIGGWR